MREFTLLVEDDTTVRMTIQRVLRGLGLSVDTACGVEEAKTKILRGNFSVIISDVMLEDGTGVDLHKWVLSVAPDLRDRFIFCSGGLSNDLQDYIDNSGCPFFMKPLNVKELLKIWRKIIEDECDSTFKGREPTTSNGVLTE